MLRRRAVLGALAASAFTAAARAAGPSLQRLIDEATAAGRHAILPVGEIVTGPLRLPDGAHLVGQPGTRLVAAGAQPILLAAKAARITLEGVTFDGRDAALPAGEGLLSFADVAQLDVSRCDIRRAGGEGAKLERCGGRLSDLTITGPRRTGVLAVDSTGLAIEGNRIDGCGENGVLVWRSAKGPDGTRVSRNRITNIRADPGGSGQYGNGVCLFRSGGVTVEGNTIGRCAYSAVRNNGGSDVLVIGNSCSAIGETALYAEFAFDGVIFSGNAVDGAMTGVSIANLAESGGHLAIVTGNLLRNLKRKPHPATGQIEGGVGVAVEGDCAVTGNVVENAEWAGIALGWGPTLRDVTATGNLVTGAPIGISISTAPGAGGASVVGNAIAGASRGAIVGMAWDKVATADLSRDPAAAPRGVRIAENTVR